MALNELDLTNSGYLMVLK